MIPIVYEDIVVATYQLITNYDKNNFFGYKFIQMCGNMLDNSNNILILININNLHWTCAFYNNNSEKIFDNFVIPGYTLYNNIFKLKDKLEKDDTNINFISDIKYQDEFEEFNNKLNNLLNKSLKEVSNFYSSNEDIIDYIDYGTIYYYNKTKDINKGKFGIYPDNFNQITKNKGNRQDKKILNKYVKNMV